MNFDSYIISDTKTAITVLQKCPPPPYSHKGFNKLSFKKKAFTLAEVLITLTIIGIIAAMTIPTLMSKHQKQEYIVRLKKAYSTLTNAMQMIPLSNGCPSGDYICSGFIELAGFGIHSNLTTDATNILASQLKGKIYDNCGEIVSRLEGQKCILTNDGMIVYDLTSDIIAIDTNGERGPNKPNRDIWSFGMRGTYPVRVGDFGKIKTSSILEPQGSYYDSSLGLGTTCKEKLTTAYSSTSPWNAYCTNYVLTTGKMDY